MEIIVCVKQTFDTETNIVLDQQGLIDETSVKYIINPFDEFAVEAALLLTEQHGGEVTVVSAGRRDPSKALRQALAMGAAGAVWLNCGDLSGADAFTYATVLSRWLEGRDYDLIICGKEAIDDGAAEVPSRLAEALDLPQVNTVSALSVEDGTFTVRRDIEGGYETLEVDLPCVLSAQKGLNDPRYPSMRRILQAKKIKIEEVDAARLFEDEESPGPLTGIESYILPAPREGGRILNGTHEEAVEALLTALKQERKLI